MSLIDLIKKEDDKYIIVRDFINLVAHHTNDTSDIVIEYLCKFCLVDNDDVRIYIKGFANDYSNEFHLSDLIFKDDKIDDFRCYTMSELEKDNEFLISYFLKDEIFNAKYIKVLNLKTDNDKLPATYNYKAKASSTRVVLGEYQKLLITYSLFTPRQLACLIADYNPACHQDDDFYNARLDMVKNAIEAKHLTPINDKKQIAAEEAQLWLIKCGLIYNGFNSGLRYDTLETYQAEHSKQQLIVAENKADDLNLLNSSFMMGTPTVTLCDPKTIEQLNQELTAANAKIKALESELKAAKVAMADAPAEADTLQGIAKYNADKAYIISTSQALAKYIWGMDTKKAIRTGHMVQQIRHVMHNVAPNLIPDDKAIRDWLSGIAPDYAKKGGKTPKNAPSEISLIMKK